MVPLSLDEARRSSGPFDPRLRPLAALDPTGSAQLDLEHAAQRIATTAMEMEAKRVSLLLSEVAQLLEDDGCLSDETDPDAVEQLLFDVLFNGMPGNDRQRGVA